MNILVINGSPKGNKSNTWQLTKAFLAGMQEAAGNAGETLAIDEITVNRMDIRPCLGCFSCWNKTPGHCCIQDDMSEVIRKLLWADITIWSFPLYYYTVPGGLKNLIDRQLPMLLPFMTEDTSQTGNGSHPLRYDMSGKRNVVISTCGFYTAEGNYDGIYSLFDHEYGKGGYTAIFCGQGELFRVPEVSRRTGEYLGYVQKAGREYYQGGIKPETKNYLNETLYPRKIFEKWADASWGIDLQNGEKESAALVFTRQMAALYRGESYDGRERVLEMYYTDIDECYQVVLGEEGGRVVTDGSMKATTRIETPLSVWKSIAAGEIRGDEALMRQLYKVKGDFNLMLKWDDYFGGPEGGAKTTGRQVEAAQDSGIHMPDKETNMNVMLIPWMAFWILAAIDSRMGSLLTVGICGLVPLFFYRHKKTLYDILSGTLVGGFSVMALLGISARVVVPLSYLTFGIMWCISCMGRIPLTAHYSMNHYNGEDALKNPLFMKTNRILTWMWGILYLLTPIWTYALMGTELRAYTGAINSVAPILMGIFTVWFQRWYPAYVATGKKG